MVRQVGALGLLRKRVFPDFNVGAEGNREEALLKECQYLYVCTSKASKLSTFCEMSSEQAGVGVKYECSFLYIKALY